MLGWWRAQRIYRSRCVCRRARIGFIIEVALQVGSQILGCRIVPGRNGRARIDFRTIADQIAWNLPASRD